MILEPIYKVNAIRNLWPTLFDGVTRVMDVSRSDINRQEVLNNLLAGECLLWMAYKGAEYVGFAITKIMGTPPLGERTLLLSCVYSNGKASVEEWLSYSVAHMNGYALTMQCSHIDFYTTRKGFERFLQPFGFEAKYMLLTRPVVKEVCNGI